ncbi:MAG: sugar porter family MFS transporter [Parachlamydiales bacterium]|nr:sugar porter family MFS transporter [Parachlamydiales bacterium]
MRVKTSGFVLFVTVIASVGGLLFGYSTGIISGALLFMGQEFHLTVFDEELIVSILLVGALIGAVIGGTFADRLGRRKTLFITIVLFILGTLFIIMGDSLFPFLLGRFVIGLAVGIVSLTVPLYISEMSPSESRGALVSMNQLAIVMGVLLAYNINYLFSSITEWRWMFGFGLIPIFAMLVGLCFIPETPSWLAAHGKNSLAQAILRKIHRNQQKEESVIEPKKESPQEIVRWSHLLEKNIRPALVVGVMLSAFQQLTGINTVFYYAPKIFQNVGFASASSAIFATLGIGLINAIMTLVALWLLDIVGRRFLLLLGMSGMVVSLGFLGSVFFIHTALVKTIAVVSIMMYVSFFAISIGPIAWLIMAEIYPMGVRGRAMGIASFSNWTCNFLISITFLTLVDLIGSSGTFWLYAFIGILAIWFIWKKVPETKGKTLEEIQEFWKKRQ